MGHPDIDSVLSQPTKTWRGRHWFLLAFGGAVLLLASAVVLVFMLLSGPAESQYTRRLSQEWKQFKGVVVSMDKYSSSLSNLVKVQPGDTLNAFYNDVQSSVNEVLGLSHAVNEEKAEAESDIRASIAMQSALGYYAGYIVKLREFQENYTSGFWVTIDSDETLIDLKDCARQAQARIRNFEARVPSSKKEHIRPRLFAFAGTYGPQLATIKKNPEMEKQRASRDHSYWSAKENMEKTILPAYETGGYTAIAQYMTTELQKRYAGQISQAGQPDFKWPGIMDHRFTGKNKIVFEVSSQPRSGNKSKLECFEMVDLGGSWLINNIEPGHLGLQLPRISGTD